MRVWQTLGWAARLGCALGVAAAMTGCGASPPPVADEGKAQAQAVDQKPKGPSIEAEIGGLDEGAVKEAFKRAAEKLGACYGKGAERIPYLAGEVHFVVRVTRGGGVRFVYAKESTLGDRATEECMISVLKSTTWPEPQGGREGNAENSFTFAPGDGERPPVAWSPDKLGKPFKKAKSALSKCRASAGTGALKATMYVATDGKPQAIGVASSDEKGEAAIACVIGTLREITFPSPGSYASKVSLVIE